MKILVYVLGVVVALVAVVLLAGMRLPQTHHAENAAEISAPPLAVWTTISDVASGPNWRSDLKQVELLDSGRWREHGSSGDVTFRLDTSVPTQRRVVAIDDPKLPYSGTWTYVLEPLPNGNTKITIAEDANVKSALYRFVGHYIIGERSSIDRYLRDLHKSFQYPEGKKT